LLRKDQIYLGNPRLKKANVKVEYTEEQIKELARCSKDILYFCNKYMKIVNVDEGLMNFETYDFQDKIIKSVQGNRFTICKMPRQSGKTTVMTALILHFALFNEAFNVAVLANKAATAREILHRIQLGFEYLPVWMQQGIVEWNKGNIELENGSKILAGSTSSGSVRGGSFNLIYLDEFAFVPHHQQEDFFASTYPTISSGNTTRVMITSTPKGMNLFYKIWTDAIEHRNEYEAIEVHWSDVPGRDEEWKKQTIQNTSEDQFRQEFECEFMGSSNTLIHPTKLGQLVFHEPLSKSENMKVFKEPQPNHVYSICVDTSRGIGNDYSAFIIIDCSVLPYEVVATFRSNIIAPMIYPNVIYEAGKKYNNAYCLVEINDIGQQVADILHHDLEYEFIMTAQWRGRSGQIVNAGFGGGQQQMGVRTTKQLKRVGCSTLKTIIENDKLVINDFDILQELTAFSVKGTSYEAEEGYNDDLVMCLVLFAWLSNQEYFKELTDIDIRKNLFNKNEQAIEDDVLPFGFINDGTASSVAENDEFGADSLLTHAEWDIDDTQGIF
jgi:hypothetical protein